MQSFTTTNVDKLLCDGRRTGQPCLRARSRCCSGAPARLNQDQRQHCQWSGSSADASLGVVWPLAVVRWRTSKRRKPGVVARKPRKRHLSRSRLLTGVSSKHTIELGNQGTPPADECVCVRESALSGHWKNSLVWHLSLPRFDTVTDFLIVRSDDDLMTTCTTSCCLIQRMWILIQRMWTLIQFHNNDLILSKISDRFLPIWEQQRDDNKPLNQFVLHSALDVVDEAMWTTNNM